MLSAHSAISSLPETSVLRRLIKTGKFERAIRTGGVDAAIQLLDNDPRLQFLKIQWKDWFRTHKIAEAPNPALTWYKSLLGGKLYRPGIQYVLDKDPRLVECLPWIRAKLSKTLIIHVIRDPRDVLASKLATEWSKRHHWLRHVLANRVQYHAGVRFGAKDDRRQYHEIVYEELLASPKQVLGQLTNWLNIPFEENMLSFGDVAKELVRPDEISWKKETFGPLLKKNSAKWRDRLTPFQIAVTNRACSPAIKRSGQPLCDEELPFWAHLWSRLIALALAMIEQLLIIKGIP